MININETKTRLRRGAEIAFDKEKTVNVNKDMASLTTVNAGTSAINATLSKTLSAKKSFCSQISKEGFTYFISNTFDLEGNVVTLPRESTLCFKPGGMLKNGTIRGEQSCIVATGKVFDNVGVYGTWTCAGNAGWWATGCETRTLKDESAELQLALDSDFRELFFPPVPFNVGSTLVLRKEKRLIMQGSMMMGPLANRQNIDNTCIIFTDIDIPILRVAVKEGGDYSQNAVVIQGGNFDVSRCASYTSNCIEVTANDNERVWGLHIDSSIKGGYGATGGVGININPVENKDMAGNKAFVTHIRINSVIQDFGVGVKARNYMSYNPFAYYNWCTDMVVDGLIKNCPTAVDSNVEYTDIRATLQPGYYFGEKENGKSLVVYSGDKMAISSPIFDLESFSEAKWTNQYALHVSLPNTAVAMSGSFDAFVKLAKLNCKNPIKD